jgi:hypothetical protein
LVLVVSHKNTVKVIRGFSGLTDQEIPSRHKGAPVVKTTIFLLASCIKALSHDKIQQCVQMSKEQKS